MADHMKKVSVSELFGVALDWAVHVAVSGGTIDYAIWVWERRRHLVTFVDGQRVLTQPSTDWSQGGPLIPKNLVSLVYEPVDRPGAGFWRAFVHHDSPEFEDESPLIAAMRAIVHSNFGDTVEIPTELLEVSNG